MKTRAKLMATAAAFALLTTTGATAQSLTFESVDTSGDMEISREELVAVIGEAATERYFDEVDDDESGTLSVAEITGAYDDDDEDDEDDDDDDDEDFDFDDDDEDDEDEDDDDDDEDEDEEDDEDEDDDDA